MSGSSRESQRPPRKEEEANREMAVRSPMDRHTSIWSQNTNYPGAAGLHHENSKGAHAREMTIKKDHSNVMTHIEAIHQKELRSLRFNQRALRNSMLAYTEKMRKISLDKISAGDSNHIDSARRESSARKLSSLSRITEQSASTDASRLGADSTTETSELDRFSLSSGFTALSNVDSVSVVSSTKGNSKRKISEDASALSGGDGHQQNTRKDIRRLSPIHRQNSTFMTQVPRRRTAVTEAPNLSELNSDRSDARGLVLSTEDAGSEVTSQAQDNFVNTGRMSRGSDRFLDFDTDTEDPGCEITPFPKLDLPSIVVNESDPDGTESLSSIRTPKKQRHKKKKNSGRDAPIPSSSGAATAAAAAAAATSGIPNSTAKAVNKAGTRSLKTRPKSDPTSQSMRRKRPPTPPKPVHQRFRYSEAMEAALKSVTSDSSDSPDCEGEVLRYLSPEDLKAARSESVCTDASRSASVSSTPGRRRRLTISLPLSPSLDSDSDGEEEEEGVCILKSVLRKRNSANTIPSKKKSVQFKLPTIIPISPRPLDPYDDPFMCRQSETTVNIVRLED